MLVLGADSPIGLTVVREIQRVLPHEDLLYLGDTARVPYGSKSPSTVIRFACEDTQFLVQQGVKAVAVACNTASAWALPTLEKRFSVPIFGVIENMSWLELPDGSSWEGEWERGERRGQCTLLEPRSEGVALADADEVIARHAYRIDPVVLRALLELAPLSAEDFAGDAAPSWLAPLQAALDETLAALPIPKVMSYQLADGWSSVHFVRPVHGLVALHGADVVPVQALGLTAGRSTRGHPARLQHHNPSLNPAPFQQGQRQPRGFPRTGRRLQNSHTRAAERCNQRRHHLINWQTISHALC